MIRAHAVADVREAEAALMAELPPGTLMQRAAAGLAAVCAQVLKGGLPERGGGTYGARVVLLVGAGDNGGDALWAGARLARRGARVDAILTRHDRAHPEGLAALRAAGGSVVSDPASPLGPEARRALSRADIVIDGILGIGGQAGLRADAAELAEVAAAEAGLVVAVDLPSGVDPDTGEAPGAHVHADITVTFGTHKIALLVDPAAEAAGHVEFVDIGLEPYLPEPVVEALEPGDVTMMLPYPDRQADKYRRGVLGVLAGSERYPGAAVLAAGGAIHGGAGMVRYAGPGAVADGVLAHWPEIVTGPGVEAVGRVQAWAVGSGLGDGRGADVAAALAAGVPVLADADALAYLPSRLDVPALLTPHAGELARMLGVERADVEARRWHHAREAASRWNATILLKGSTTLVVTPDGEARVNPTGSPALATAGSGDVLAGFAGALLATGLSPLDAGSVAAYIHGMAGQAAASRAGAPSASMVLDALPTVVAAMCS
ncbi:NAD(P)H-hydrate dehydratase [Actinobacteria bacterium YIM 96077]|uniref:Bifunctional NAD(P)H-hydrate repair enzyme n=1 Tax=Phytoactinopolyspora halophila TaxID=1981511 RepID=A0A329QGM0_9ACTN|nr:NAD(P)H-hydrate dehydratase [Phytoactinopolyspora halophila]AYY14696.1 NAD(P)H-hydrate dehydratase [Actinobacteria bacterium YIM 96077]RAW11593.1 bifunctional ADP-dependent NAD(P)H-hydrate dehydratase/NAD(P)H-hydrate epimerase [Phytoactinopolyspora halophila]